MKLLITTHPFNEDTSKFPGEVIYNTKGSKYTQEEINELLIKENPDYIIAGTEKYGKEQIENCKNLKVISRLGVGTTSIDHDVCKNKGIKILITPDAPTNAVAELAMTNILSLLKRITQQEMWSKKQGREISECVIGIVGYGRIGKRLHELIKVFTPKKVLICDPTYNNTSCVKKVFKESDVVTLHTPELDQIIDKRLLNQTKEECIIVNTARADIINYDHLIEWLIERPSSSAAIDVFNIEPNDGKEFENLKNVILTPHIGSYTTRTRKLMEKQSFENIMEVV